MVMPRAQSVCAGCLENGDVLVQVVAILGGIEQLMVDGLRGDHHGGAEDDAGRSAAADFGSWFRKASQNRAVVTGAGQGVDEFRRDIGRVEVGENEDVGLSGDRSIDFFGLCRDRVERGIDLEFAVDFHGDAEGERFLARHFGGGFHFGNGWVSTRFTFTGVAEQRHVGLTVGQVIAECRRRYSDVAKLLARWIGHYGAVGEEKLAVFTRIMIFEVEDVQ